MLDILLFGLYYFVLDVIRGDYASALRVFPFAIPGFALLGGLIYGFIKYPLEFAKGTLAVVMMLILLALVWYFVTTVTVGNALVRVIIAVPVFFLILNLVTKRPFNEGANASTRHE